MKGNWLFVIGSSYYSTKAITILGHSYLARIIPDSFSGISLRCDVSSRLFQPNECEFEISNADQTLDAADFDGERVTISLTDTGYAGIFCQWSFIIQSAVEYYGKIKCICIDPISAKLTGDYPRTPTIKSAFPDGKANVDETWRVPRTFGQVFIPVVPVYKDGQRHYVMGPSSVGNYTIDLMQSPREYAYQGDWDSDNYTFDQYNLAGPYYSTVVRAMQAMIGYDAEGNPNSANGVWVPGGENSILCPLLKYTGETAECGPGTFIATVLEDIGVLNLNEASFDAVDTALTPIKWNAAFYQAEAVEPLIGDMLTNCDCYLWFDDEIHISQFSNDYVESLDKSKIKKDSFKVSRITQDDYNGGIVKFYWPDEPQDIMAGQGIAPLYMAGFDIGSSHDNPTSETFEYRFETKGDYSRANSINAMKFGCLYFQKKLDQRFSVSFSTTVDALATFETLRPGQVLRVNDNAVGAYPAYGAAMDVVVTAMTINYDLSIDIEGTVYNHLDDYNSTSNAYAIYKEVGADTDFNFAARGLTVEGDPDSAPCMMAAVADTYPADNTPIRGTFTILKSEAKAWAENLWRSLGDAAIFEPWGTTITEINSWTGDTSDFAITDGVLTGEFVTSDSKSLTLDLSADPISAEDFRFRATGTITGTSENTYLRLKITDDIANVAYLYILIGDEGFTPGADEYLIGDGDGAMMTVALADYGITGAVAEVVIQCAVHSGDAALDVEIDYLDIERYHDFTGDCGTCADAGAYIIRKREDDDSYTPYVAAYDECATPVVSSPDVYFGPETGLDPCGIPSQTDTVGMVNGPIYSRNAAFKARIDETPAFITDLQEGETTVYYEVEDFDECNCFDHATGVFTAPYTGVYFFMGKVVASELDITKSIRVTAGDAFDHTYATYKELSALPTDPVHLPPLSGLVLLQKDETISMVVTIETGDGENTNLEPGTVFSGYFIGSFIDQLECGS